MAVAMGSQKICCKATRERCHRVRRCSRVLIDRHNQGKAKLNDSVWSNEVRAPVLLLTFNAFGIIAGSLACSLLLSLAGTNWSLWRFEEFDLRSGVE